MIFKYNPDINKNAYMNWRTRKEWPIYDMNIIADGYTKGAIIMIDECLRDNRDKKADIIIFPILFSIMHAVELYLKSMEWSLNLLLKIKDGFSKGHDIKQNWINVKLLIKKYDLSSGDVLSDNDFIAFFDNFIDDIYNQINIKKYKNKKTKNMDFARYPLNSSNEYHFYVEKLENVVIDLEKLKSDFINISSNLDAMSGYFEDLSTNNPVE